MSNQIKLNYLRLQLFAAKLKFAKQIIYYFITFQIAKPICIVNDYLPLLFKKQCKEDLYVYLVVSDNKNVILQNEHLLLSKEITNINLKLNENIGIGTKAVSAYILANDGLSIIESYAGVVHITDGKHGDYQVFKMIRFDGVLPKVKKYKIAEEISWAKNASHASDKGFEFAWDYSMTDFINQMIPDNGFRKIYKTNDPLSLVQNYIALNSTNKGS